MSTFSEKVVKERSKFGGKVVKKLSKCCQNLEIFLEKSLEKLVEKL